MDKGNAKKTYLKIFKFLGSAAITGALLYVVFSEQSLSEFSSLILDVSKAGLATYLAINLFAIVLRAKRYQLLLQTLELEKQAPSTPAMLIVTVVRNDPEGGTITTSDPTTICVDGTPDPIDVTLTGEALVVFR